MRAAWRLVMVTAVLWCAVVAHAQQAVTGSRAERDEPVLRGAAGSAGINLYKQEHWGIVATGVSNPTDREVEVLVTLRFDGLPQVQFASPVWLPPNSSRRVWFPVRAPRLPEPKGSDNDADSPIGRQFATEGLLLDIGAGDGPAGGGGERQIARQQGILVQSRDRWVSGAMTDLEDDEAIRTAVAMRRTIDLSQRLAFLNDRSAPSIAAGYDALDTLVICANRPDLDTAQTAAIRQWIMAGGRLWVMLDHVDPAFLSILLGDDWTIQTVDRVQLPSYTIEPAALGKERTTMSFEQPPQMLRVLGGDFEPLHTINGWPASLRKRIGDGDVLVTTLDPRGWRHEFDPRKGEEEQELSPQDRKRFNDARRPLTDLSSWFNRRSNVEPDPLAPFERLGVEQIGYRVANKSVVASLLLLFCVAVGAAGLWFGKRQRLELAGAAAGALAVLAAGVLVAVGSASREELPRSAAHSQLVRVAPGQRHAVARGVLSVFSPTSEPADLSATGGGVLWPRQAQTAGRTMRMVWTDFDRWRWEHVDVAASAVSNARYARVIRLDQPVDAEFTFGPDGLVGRVRTGRFGELSDAILATRTGRLALEPGAEGQSRASSVLLGDQVMPTSMLDYTQQQRQRVYQHLLPLPGALAGTPGSIDQPTVLGWASDTIDLGFKALDGEVRRVNETLVAIPVTLQRPAAGTRVTVPSPMLPFDALRDEKHRGGVSLFNPVTGEWMQVSQGGRAFLRFSVPEQVLPLKLESGTLRMRINAPGRSVRVVRLVGDGETPLRETGGANKLVEYAVVPRGESGDGVVTADEPWFDIAIHVSDVPGASEGGAMRLWGIDLLELTLKGDVQ